jgi:hypothetical protein
MRLVKLTTIAAAIMGSAIALSSLPAYATEGGKALRRETLSMIKIKAARSTTDTAHWFRVEKVINETPDDAFDQIDFAFADLCSRPITKNQVNDIVVDHMLMHDKKLSDQRVEWKLARALSEAVSTTLIMSSLRNCPVINDQP